MKKFSFLVLPVLILSLLFVVPSLAADTQPEASYQDFSLTISGMYSDESLFPNPDVLQDLCTEWEQEWLDPSGENYEWYGKFAAENHTVPKLFWALTEDFDRDGKKETFFAYGANHQASMLGTVGLYFLSASGGLQKLDSQPYFEGAALRYPDQTQFLYSTSSAGGLSAYGCILQVEGGQVSKLLDTQTSFFSKKGPFIYTAPRTGALTDTEDLYYCWDGESGEYREIPAQRAEMVPAAEDASAVSDEQSKQLIKLLKKQVNLQELEYFDEDDFAVRRIVRNGSRCYWIAVGTENFCVSLQQDKITIINPFQGDTVLWAKEKTLS